MTNADKILDIRIFWYHYLKLRCFFKKILSKIDKNLDDIPVLFSITRTEIENKNNVIDKDLLILRILFNYLVLLKII